MLTPTQHSKILRLADQFVRVADIAVALGVSKGQVYALLKAERPDRCRSPRTRTSDMPERIRNLDLPPREIAELLGCSRAYVYRILKEERNGYAD